MKNILILTILFIASNSFACLNPINYDNAVIAIASGPSATEISCKSGECLCADGIEWKHASFESYQADDLANPIYAAESEVEECAGQAACEELLIAKVCPSLKYINSSYSQVYCTEVVGYQQLTKQKLVNDPAKIAAVKAAKEAEDGLTKQEIIDLKALIEELRDPTDIDAATNLNQLKAATKDKVKKTGRILKFMMKQLKGE